MSRSQACLIFLNGLQYFKQARTRAWERSYNMNMSPHVTSGHQNSHISWAGCMGVGVCVCVCVCGGGGGGGGWHAFR